jgi:Pentapeptide repeats (8 copies)
MSENTPPETKAALFTAEELCAKAHEICKARNGQDLIKDDWDNAFKVLTKERNSWWKRFKKWVQTGEDGWNEKKPWDYLQLLLVPLALFIAASWFQWFTKQQEQLAADNKAKQELQVAGDKAKQETLTKYLDQMSDLLQKGLLKSKQGSEIFIIAQAKTAVTLQSLDPVRQHLVIQFLAASNLNILDGGKGLLFQLRMSRAKLDKADLSFARMTEVDLSEAKLSGADLIGADLRGANLIGANLSQANLPYASLIEANLFGADFRGADLRGVLLMGTDLTTTKLEKKQLERDSLLLCKVILPKGIEIKVDRDCEAMPQALLKKYPGKFKTLEDAKKYKDNIKLPKSN